MRKHFEDKLNVFLDDYCRTRGIERLWKRPIVRFADAGNFDTFLPYVHPEHLRPEALLDNATVALSVFFPYLEFVAKSNWEGNKASKLWNDAYTYTNAMAVFACEFLAEEVEKLGYSADIPVSAGEFKNEELMSRWSQRHVAWLAGQGTFGINNMLISDNGCCGRYFSILTTLTAEPDRPLEKERCLYKRDGSCGICADRCPVGALTRDGFDRFKCYEWLKQADYDELVCGKCDVKLPCSHRAT